MKILGMKLPTKEYISQVYTTYFKADPIGIEMIKGLSYDMKGE